MSQECENFRNCKCEAITDGIRASTYHGMRFAFCRSCAERFDAQFHHMGVGSGPQFNRPDTEPMGQRRL